MKNKPNWKLYISILYIIIIIPAVAIFTVRTYKNLKYIFILEDKEREKVIELSLKYYNKGQEYFKNKKFDKALVEFEKSLKIKDPYYHDSSYRLLIDTYKELKKSDEAIKLIEDDISKEPRNDFYYSLLINLLVELKDYDSAAQWAKKGTKNFPYSTEIPTLYGFILNQQGAYEKAEDFLKGNLKNCPKKECERHYKELIYSLSKQGKDEALEHYIKNYFQDTSFDFLSKPKKKEKDFATVLLDRFILKKISKKLETSLKITAEDILELKGSSYLKHEPAEAIKIFNQILKENPKMIRILKSTAEAYELLGIKDEAKGIYEKILEINPSDAEAKEALKRF